MSKIATPGIRDPNLTLSNSKSLILDNVRIDHYHHLPELTDPAMPDGDKRPPNVTRLYEKSYRFLCDPSTTVDDCTRALREALKRQLQRDGDSVPRACRALAAVLSTLNEATSPSDFLSINQRVDECLRRHPGLMSHQEGLLRQVARDLVQQVRYGGQTSLWVSVPDLYASYALRRFDAMLTAMKTKAVRSQIVDVGSLATRIQECRLMISEEASHFGRTIAQTGKTANLRCLPRSRPTQDEILGGNLL